MSDMCLGECCGACFYCCDKVFHACCPNKKLYPVLSTKKACIAFCINCVPFLSGIGTIYAACQDEVEPGYRCKIITMGIFQFLLFPVIVGWFWSMSYGARLSDLAEENKKKQAKKGLFDFSTVELTPMQTLQMAQ